MRAKVQAALDDLRPYIQADGGDVELISVQNGVATVRLTGHCVGCPSATITLKSGIEAHLKQKVPGIRAVRQTPSDDEAAADLDDHPERSPFDPSQPEVKPVPKMPAKVAKGSELALAPITTGLRETHRKAEALLRRMDKVLEEIEKGSRDQEQIELLQEVSIFLKTELEAHMHQEDEVLFPALIPFISWGKPMSAMAKQHDILHDEIEAFSPALAAFKKGAGPESLVRLGRSLAQRLRDDFYQEEAVLFIEADESLTGARASVLREAMNRIAAAHGRQVG